jgi:tRNA G37 N-methylase Trm5
MGYENFTMNEALKILLPNLTDKEIPSGFEVIGDIAHMNL